MFSVSIVGVLIQWHCDWALDLLLLTFSAEVKGLSWIVTVASSCLAACRWRCLVVVRCTSGLRCLLLGLLFSVGRFCSCIGAVVHRPSAHCFCCQPWIVGAGFWCTLICWLSTLLESFLAINLPIGILSWFWIYLLDSVCCLQSLDTTFPRHYLTSTTTHAKTALGRVWVWTLDQSLYWWVMLANKRNSYYVHSCAKH